ncbi:MAG: endonuclease/exonuclease/phosphatase family protein, partial [Myxococcales bacterium]
TGAAGAPVEPLIAGIKVRVATFNIRTGNADQGTKNAWDKRKALLFDVFKDLDADFIGVQEARLFQLQEIDQAAPGYDRIGEGRDGGNEGEFSAIYYRKDRFEVKDKETFWLSATPGKPSKSWDDDYNRVVTWGRFQEKASGYQLYHFNTHWGLTSNSAEKSAALLTKRVSQRPTGHPFFVTGDLNTGENELPVRFLKGNAKIDGQDNPVPMRDTFRVLYPDATDVRTAHGFNGGTSGAKIDFVFIGLPAPDVTGAQIVRTHKGDQYPSDHYPVVAGVKLPDQTK